MKIRQKMMLCIVGIALTVPIVGALSIYAGQKTIERIASESSIVSAARLLNQMNQGILSEINWFREITAASRVQNTLKESNQKFSELDNVSSYIAEQDGSWLKSEPNEITPFMRQIIDDPLSERLREKMQFADAEYGYKVYGELFITNKYGANIAQTGKTTDYYQADERWWQLARRDGIYISEVGYDKSSGVYSLDICLRIDDESKFLGVMKICLNIDGITRILTNAQITEGNDVRFMLLDKNDVVIFPRSDQNYGNRLSCGYSGEDRCQSHYQINYAGRRGKGDKLIVHVHSPDDINRGDIGWQLVMERSIENIFAPLSTLKETIVVISLVITAIAVIAGFIFSSRITMRLSMLAEAAMQMGSGRFDTRVKRQSNDEIGELAESLNKMAANLESSTTSIEVLNREIAERQRAEERLAQANKKMLETAMKAGKAEVASAVLHNVGNAINSISVLAGTIKDRLRRMKLHNLSKAVTLLEEHGKDAGDFLTKDHKGTKLLPYLVTLLEELTAEQQYMLDKMEALGQQVHHTKDIIHIQQSQSKSKGIIETAAVPDLIEDAIRINYTAIEQHNIEIVRRYAELPSLEIDRSKAVQILVNLVNNAVYAVLAADVERKVITLSTRAMTDEYVQIEVTDNGVGISRENTARLFEYGFTTKKKGHGFGLHGGAIAAKKMGGKLTAYSRGEGKGATFILELPVKCARPVEVEV